MNEFNTPRPRGLLALHLAAAAAGAMVIVDTVVQISANLELGESEVAITLGLFGAGSNAGRLLRRSARIGGRSALFDSQFTQSNVCWLVTYPLTG